MRFSCFFTLLFLIGCYSNPSTVVTNSDKKPDLPTTYKIVRPSNEDNIEWDVIDFMWDHVSFYEDEANYQRTIQPASKGQLAIYACTWYMHEVNNGGHDQFFYNSTGMVWKDALEGFTLLGAKKHNAILSKALAVFPNSEPSFDRKNRISQLSSADTSLYDNLDDQFYEIDEDLTELFSKYIADNPDEFFIEP